MTETQYRHWNVVRTAEIAAPKTEVWDLIGGFYTLHLWHPDISMTEVPPEQTAVSALRRLLTFPGQPKTTEELVTMHNAECHYRYKWHAGQWGEEVLNYRASLRVFAGDLDRSCIVQWASEFDYPTDAISDFYEHGFQSLRERFGTV